MKLIAIRITQTLAVIVALLLGIAVAAPADAAGTYNRSAAANYAKTYSCNENTSCRNGNFRQFGGDCTNFVSQAMWAGGKQNYQGSGPVWYWLARDTYSNSWVQVSGLKTFLSANSRVTMERTNMDGGFTNAKLGDLYIYDWGRGEGWSHLSMETGAGTFANIVDTKTKRNYRTITGGKGDFIAQHTTDRDGSPWNWGYQTEKDPKIKAKMKTVIIHIKDGW